MEEMDYGERKMGDEMTRKTRNNVESEKNEDSHGERGTVLATEREGAGRRSEECEKTR